MKKKDEEENMEVMHEHKVSQMIKSAEGSAGLLHKNLKAYSMHGGAQILINEEEDARLLDRCEAKRKEWGKHWQYNQEAQNVKDKPWKNEALRSAEEALSEAERVSLGRSVDIVSSKNRSRM